MIKYDLLGVKQGGPILHGISNRTRQSEMADLARRATRWVGTLSDGEGLDYDVGYTVIYRNFIWGVRTSTPVDLGNYNA